MVTTRIATKSSIEAAAAIPKSNASNATLDVQAHDLGARSGPPPVMMIASVNALKAQIAESSTEVAIEAPSAG